MRRTCVSLLAAPLAFACAYPVERHDWSGYQGDGARHFHAEELEPPSFPDPMEPVNRSTSALNHALIVGIANPLGHVYRAVIPHYARERLRDFAANLLWPRNLVTNLLQAKWRHAGSETARFAINTTLGVAGLWDPAAYWWSIEPHPEDFGQVFGVWGWRPSSFVMLPLVGPSTLRDTLGLVPDKLLDPTLYFLPFPYLSYPLTYNELVDSIEPYEQFVASTFDPYDDAHVVWTLNRNEEISEPPPPLPTEGDDTGAVQTLESAFLAPRDPAFWGRLRTGSAFVATTGQKLPYSYRLRPAAAPVVFVVPGVGVHRLGASTLALAEMAWNRGFSVVLVSNALCFEFMQRAASVAVPGHAPADARDLHAALDAVARDLEARHPGRAGSRVFLGYSLGAFHGFFIAAADAPESALAHFERYVLLDPPVRLIEGLEQLDRFYNAPLVYPPEERALEVRRILRKALRVAKQALDPGAPAYSRVDATALGSAGLEPAVELPFTNLEAEYLIGLAFRRTLQSVLWVSQQREDLGVLRSRRSALRRSAAYQEIAEYSYSEYLYAFVLPYYRDRLGFVSTAEELLRENDLHAIAEPLRGDPKLRVFANTNDFLTSKDDVRWLSELLGPERVSLFPTGGHLGNLHKPEVQRAIMDSLEDLLPPPAPSP